MGSWSLVAACGLEGGAAGLGIGVGCRVWPGGLSGQTGGNINCSGGGSEPED
ncbi:hypothetical protein DM860_013032 [Cuscuta australis]|uniref:Uncharacterized protein n=1 Tax=Cuscuta australis TaxID=267555 RepID=A0A328D689_9ASTE|nr:hypothetical protein DM860_013032 [Cuscuta australis]